MLDVSFLNVFYQLIGILMVPLILLYVVFAFVLLRQVQLMNTTFKTVWGAVFVFMASVHFFATFFLLLIALLAAF
ncbi:MAG: hypothetical protein RLY61_348 [Candidatus Parcubacteria bacterium]|jgi:hypothetical protein